jgi:uncharacterized protein (DUF58 family)
MKFRAFLFLTLIAAESAFTDFAGAKFALAASVVFVLLCGVYVRMHRIHLSLSRSLKGENLFIGFQDENVLTISNNCPFPLHAAEVSDYGDIDIKGSGNSVFVASAEAGKNCSNGYAITGRRRGKFRLGPTEIAVSDPAGFFSRKKIIDNGRDIIVYPEIFPVTGLKIRSFQPLGSIKFDLPIFEDHTILSGAREYQPGDDTRKINWRLSAKLGKPVVNTFQSTVSAEIMIALNLFADDFRERRRSVHEEESIGCAASLAVLFSRRGLKTGICVNGSVGNTDSIVRVAPGKDPYSLREILSTLALAQTTRVKSGTELLDTLTPLPWGSSVYYITPSIDERSAARLTNLSGKGYQVFLVSIDADNGDIVPINVAGVSRYTAQIRDGVIRLSKV